MINKNKTRLVLSVDTVKLKELKKRAIENNLTLSDYLVESAVTQYFYKLTGDITLKVEYVGQAKPGSEFWRIDVEFLEARTGKWLRGSWYEVYVSETYIEDLFSLPTSPRPRDIVDFAFRFVAGRFEREGNALPKEYGAFISSRTQEILIDNRQIMWEELKKLEMNQKA